MKELLGAAVVLLLLTAGLIIGLLALFDAHTTSEEYRRFKLSNGETVECRSAMTGRCGVSLGKCRDGRSFGCQINVEQL